MAQVIVMVGTTKGAFLLESDDRRQAWKLSAPLLRGETVYAINFDGRAGRRRLLAGSRDEHFAVELRHSDDLGQSWSKSERPNIQFPEGAGLSVARVWQIVPDPHDPDTLYAGVEPAALFISRNAGESWELVAGLHAHPHRPQWQPGGGGLTLHTVLPHPTRKGELTVAISTGGVYRTKDGGETWEASNSGVRAEFLPNKHPEFGQCVHKVVRDATTPDRLFLQNHWGLYRSEDNGTSWTDIASGVPSDFGFALAAHPRRPKTAYIIPLESDMFRVAPGGALQVFRTTDGEKWESTSAGLPTREAYETVLRDDMAADSLNPHGLYFGTRSGKIYASADEAGSWRLIQDGLPPVTCVKVAVME